MTVYGVAQLTIRDRATYDRYSAMFLPTLRRHNGTLLVADDQPRVVEGRWDAQKIVIAAFDDEAAFERWYHSSAYRAIVGDRLAATHGPLIVAKGVRRT
ncbi:MAG TPA: DUF1330 domain-containing protein [Acidimicrobiia bacterium]|nr:DUF1330 domain-containing protein [Acidimicrobiia bacterium]